MSKTTIEKPNLKEINHQIYEYTKATIVLAKKMSAYKALYGRKNLVEFTPFDETRINVLCGIGNSILSDSFNLLPEHISELHGTPDSSAKIYKEKILRDNLKPSQLRKLIREENKKIKSDSKEKNIKVNKLNKHLLMLSNSLRGLDLTTRQRALSMITNNLLNI